MKTILEKTIKIIENRLNPEVQIASKTNLYNDLKADSIDVIDIIMFLEDELIY